MAMIPRTGEHGGRNPWHTHLGEQAAAVLRAGQRMCLSLTDRHSCSYKSPLSIIVMLSLGDTSTNHNAKRLPPMRARTRTGMYRSSRGIRPRVSRRFGKSTNLRRLMQAGLPAEQYPLTPQCTDCMTAGAETGGTIVGASWH